MLIREYFVMVIHVRFLAKVAHFSSKVNYDQPRLKMNHAHRIGFSCQRIPSCAQLQNMLVH